MDNTADAAAQDSVHEEPEILTPERLDRENRQHDRILAWLLVGVAFLLASFPVADPDIWMHLRTGQMIVRGEFPWGQDPYAYTVSNPWVHPGWLSDVLLWLTYDLLGGPGLVLLRGLIVVAVTMLLLRLQRPRGNGLVAVLCLGLSLVAMSPRFYLRPELLSLLCLTATLAILSAPAGATPTGLLATIVRPMHGRLYLLLIPLFALWANLDAWFLLGPITVVLWLVGAWLQQRLGGISTAADFPPAPERRALALAGIASLLACFLNPWHVHVFRLPGDLASPALQYVQAHKTDLRLDLILRPWLSPWQGEQFSNLANLPAPYYLGLSPAEWCYYPLAVLGMFTLLVRLLRGRWHWSLMWLGFFALGAYQSRNVAFFAVVSAPFLTLSLQDFLSRRRELPRVQRVVVLGGQLARLAILLALVTLVTFSFLPYSPPTATRVGSEVVRGWIHPLGGIGWSVLAEPSLVQVMERLHAWRSKGQLAGQGLLLDWYEQPGYQVFFDPGGKHFFDRRFGQFEPSTVAEFTDAFAALRESSRPAIFVFWDVVQRDGLGFGWEAIRQARSEIQARQRRWQAVFRRHEITYIVLSHRMVSWPIRVQNREQRQAVNMVEALLQEVDAFSLEEARPVWRMLNHVDGQTFILAWNDAPQASALQPLAYEAAALYRQPVSTEERASWAKEPLKQEPESFSAALLGGHLKGTPTASEAAAWHLRRAGNIRNLLTPPPQEFVFGTFLSMMDLLADQGGSYAAGQPWLPIPAVLPHLMPYGQPFPTEETILAIRACRRGLAETSRNTIQGPQQRGRLYLQLAQAYQSLADLERLTVGVQPPELRDHQYFFALHQAAELLPDDIRVQILLTREYARRGLTDVTLERYERHLAELRRQPMPQVRAVDGGMRPPTEKEMERLANDLERGLQADLQVDLGQLRRMVAEQRQRYADAAAQLRNSPLDRASFAYQLNLVGQALKDLDELNEIKPGGRAQTQEEARRLNQLSTVLNFRMGNLPGLMHLLPLFQHTVSANDLTAQQLPFYAYAAAGAYEEAENYLQHVEQAFKRMAVQRLIAGGELQSLGGATGLANMTVLRDVTGSHFAGQSVNLEGANFAEQRARLYLGAGLVALEAGLLDKAKAHFAKAAEVAPESVVRPLAGQYFLRMTGQFIDTHEVTRHGKR